LKHHRPGLRTSLLRGWGEEGPPDRRDREEYSEEGGVLGVQLLGNTFYSERTKKGRKVFTRRDQRKKGGNEKKIFVGERFKFNYFSVVKKNGESEKGEGKSTQERGEVYPGGHYNF